LIQYFAYKLLPNLIRKIDPKSSLEEFRGFENGNREIGDDYLKTVGIVIAGDGVEAASLVVGRNIKSEDKVIHFFS
jgi:hypothetical protein